MLFTIVHFIVQFHFEPKARLETDLLYPHSRESCLQESNLHLQTPKNPWIQTDLNRLNMFEKYWNGFNGLWITFLKLVRFADLRSPCRTDLL